jgi:hypothetical protein
MDPIQVLPEPCNLDEEFLRRLGQISVLPSTGNMNNIV